jgi:hypothetical protein
VRSSIAFKLPKQQELRQESDRACSVPVFARLTGVAEDQLLSELPQASDGDISVNQWITWLEGLGFTVLGRDGGPDDIVPCAHLVGPHTPRSPKDCHWIYRDEHGDVHDPSHGLEAVPADHPTMRDLSAYSRKFLTLSVSRP